MNLLGCGMVRGKSSISPSKRGQLGILELGLLGHVWWEGKKYQSLNRGLPWESEVPHDCGDWGRLSQWNIFCWIIPGLYMRYRGGCFPRLQNLKSLGSFKVNCSHGGREDLAQIRSYLPGTVWHSLLWFSGREKLSQEGRSCLAGFLYLNCSRKGVAFCPLAQGWISEGSAVYTVSGKALRSITWTVW